MAGFQSSKGLGLILKGEWQNHPPSIMAICHRIIGQRSIGIDPSHNSRNDIAGNANCYPATRICRH